MENIDVFNGIREKYLLKIYSNEKVAKKKS